mmetsp:Transcript_7005/g.14149  ORF Transcript_7005/g.14149 Transcript_7005/m.14149 type:complete len:170 (-) Transcript_7005:17-526(-)
MTILANQPEVHNIDRDLFLPQDDDEVEAPIPLTQGYVELLCDHMSTPATFKGTMRPYPGLTVTFTHHHTPTKRGHFTSKSHASVICCCCIPLEKLTGEGGGDWKGWSWEASDGHFETATLLEFDGNKVTYSLVGTDRKGKVFTQTIVVTPPDKWERDFGGMGTLSMQRI